MPAWGIRTALVALRTFMGEEGTAGQVGGMEASKEVRQRMAKSSKQWTCDGCGGKTNEERMNEWWEICREKGIKVQEEAGLDELPEGLKLGFKDQIGKGETKAAAEKGTSIHTTGEINGMSNGDSTVTTAESVPGAIEDASSKPEPGRTENLSVPSPDTSKVESAEASKPSASTSSTDHASDPSQPAGASSSEARSITSQPTTATAAGQEAPVATPILDKAISGLVLALLFMVLKKVLYNPNVIAYDY